MLAWIRLPEFLVELINEYLLLQIGNKLGREVKYIRKSQLTHKRN